jgi:putative MATE family efflux protein
MKKNLTQDSILKVLLTLALPIMGTAFLQMAYNLVDMIWLGRVGSDAVAAAGTAGFYMWLAFAFILLTKIGAEIKVSQNLGAGNFESAKIYGTSAFQFNIFVAILYSVGLLLLKKPLIAFFNLNDAYVIEKSISYLTIIAWGTVFAFINPVITGIFNGYGDSKSPFFINTIGLVVNIVLDPILIMGYGNFKGYGVEGAAFATILSQFIVTVVFILYVKSGRSILGKFSFLSKPDKRKIKEMVRLGFPVALQNALFTVFTMGVARIIAFWGPIAIAAQKVGSQVESVSWMTSGGFQGALGAFTGQNYGAKKYDRIKKAYYLSILIMGTIGLIANLSLYFFAEEIFKVFIPVSENMEYGISYLKIISFSQIFMCIEITTGGAFNGIGRTVPPSAIGIIFNGIRIPLAMFMGIYLALGIDGVWWSLTISSVFKGVLLFIWFMYIMKKSFPKTENSM